MIASKVKLSLVLNGMGNDTKLLSGYFFFLDVICFKTLPEL